MQRQLIFFKTPAYPIPPGYSETTGLIFERYPKILDAVITIVKDYIGLENYNNASDNVRRDISRVFYNALHILLEESIGKPFRDNSTGIVIGFSRRSMTDIPETDLENANSLAWHMNVALSDIGVLLQGRGHQLDP